MSKIIIITTPVVPTPHKSDTGPVDDGTYDVQALGADGQPLLNSEKALILRAAADAVEALGDEGQNVRDDAKAQGDAATNAGKAPAMPDTNVNVTGKQAT